MLIGEQSEVDYQSPLILVGKLAPLSEDEVSCIIADLSSASGQLDPVKLLWLSKLCSLKLDPVNTITINCSLHEGIAPRNWKIAIVGTLLKKLGNNLVQVPVSKLSMVSNEFSITAMTKHHYQFNNRLTVNSILRSRHVWKSRAVFFLTWIERNLWYPRFETAFNTLDGSITYVLRLDLVNVMMSFSGLISVRYKSYQQLAILNNLWCLLWCSSRKLSCSRPLHTLLFYVDKRTWLWFMDISTPSRCMSLLLCWRVKLFLWWTVIFQLFMCMWIHYTVFMVSTTSTLFYLNNSPTLGKWIVKREILDEMFWMFTSLERLDFAYKRRWQVRVWILMKGSTMVIMMTTMIIIDIDKNFK